MSWAASIGQGVGSGIGSAASGIISGLWGKYESDRAWKRQKKVLKNQIQWRVNDMRAAGLNPLLAVSGGVGGGAGAVPQGRPGARGGDFDLSAVLQRTASARQLRAAEESDWEDAELKYAQRNLVQQQASFVEMQKEAYEKEVTSAKQLDKLYKDMPYLRAAQDIVKGFSPFIPRTGAAVNMRR